MLGYGPSICRKILLRGNHLTGFEKGNTTNKWLMASLSRFSNDFRLLCLNILTLATLERTPNLIDAWLNSSEITRQPFPTKAGIMVEFVAKPMLPQSQ